MKKLTVLLTLLLFSCTSDKDEHLNVAKEFATNLLKGQSNKAKEFSTESSHNIIDATKGRQKVFPNFEFTILSDSINKNEAWVKFSDKNNPKLKDNLYLMKVEDKWLVHIKRN